MQFGMKFRFIQMEFSYNMYTMGCGLYEFRWYVNEGLVFMLTQEGVGIA
jgi:hypothetical protein